MKRFIKEVKPSWQFNTSKFVESDDLDEIATDYWQCQECIKRKNDEKI